MKIRHLFTICILILFLLMNAGNSVAVVTGTVTDIFGEPVSGVTVKFTDESNPDNRFSDITDDQGKYEIDISGVYVSHESAPEIFSLGQNYPNPFNPATTIPYMLGKAGNVRIDIFTITGQRIRTLVDEYRPVGSHTVVWDVCDDDGNSISAGVYIYRLQTAGGSKAHKMLLLDGGYTAMNGGKPSPSYGVAVHSSKTATATWRVEITGNDIKTYTENNLIFIGGKTYNFTVTRIYEIIKYSGISFASLPGGTFHMGNVENSLFGDANEKPVHTVTILPFEISIYEITQEQYQSLIGMNPSYYKTGDDYPVERVSWYDAVKFCNKLSEVMGYEKCYFDSGNWDCDFTKNGFRLSTEAEWEYACRAGTKMNFYSGNRISSNGVFSIDLEEAGWYTGSKEPQKPKIVGEKLPNAFGLYDMHGNVWEWCNDWYGTYTSNNGTDPKGPSTGSHRVLRGGCLNSEAMYCRSAFRSHNQPSYLDTYIGLRIIRRPDERQNIPFIYIPGGTFQMGDEVGDLLESCRPVHTVTVSSFKMSIYEVTNAQYAVYLNEALKSGDIIATSSRVTGARGDYNGQVYINLDGYYRSHPDNDCKIMYGNGLFSVKTNYANRPVTWVSWYGAKSFALYYGYDLPREAEWEYACRGGKQYEYGTDDGTISTGKANYWDSGILHPVAVGSYPENPFGLYDMSGNVFEWCHDWYGDYPSGSVIDPTGIQNGSLRVVRGGSWNYDSIGCRSAYRDDFYPNGWYGTIGFRVVRR